MDETTNGRDRPLVPEPTPEGRARLLTALDLERARHPVDPGQLGEYVELLDHEGLAAARAAFPSVAAHLAAGCDACNGEVRELRELATLDEPDAGQIGASPGPEADLRRIAGPAPPGPIPVPPADATGAAQPGAVAAASRRRQRRVLMTGLTAVAALAMVVMGASLYALLSLAPRGGSGEIKLIARETLTPASSSSAPIATAAPPTTAAAFPPTPNAVAATASAPGVATAPAAVPSTAPAGAPPTAASPSAAITSASPSLPGAGSQPKPGAASGSAATSSSAPTGNDCPDSHPVKANRESGIYHLRGGAFYDRTRPEVCYASPDDAERAGYRRSQR